MIAQNTVQGFLDAGANVSVVTQFDVPMVTNGDVDRKAGRQRGTPSAVNADGVVVL